VRDQPIPRQSGDADGEAERRRKHDPERGHQKRIKRPTQMARPNVDVLDE